MPKKASLAFKQNLKEWEAALEAGGELSEEKACRSGSRTSMTPKGKSI